jgi:hypothetical protein
MSLMLNWSLSGAASGEAWTIKPQGYTLEEESMVGPLEVGRQTLEMVKTYKAEAELWQREYEEQQATFGETLDSYRHSLEDLETQMNADLAFQQHKRFFNGLGTGFIISIVVGGIFLVGSGL